jgi:hypothetical protein
MGACGCGDYNGTWRIPGPDGRWYVIGPYYGCNNGWHEGWTPNRVLIADARYYTVVPKQPKPPARGRRGK